MAALNKEPKALADFAAHDVELQDVEQSHVPPKYRGTEEDRLQMKVLGRVQETRRMFNFITMLGFGSTLMVTWVRDFGTNIPA